jgi:hypothetical protein
MGEILSLTDTPVPGILVIGGLLFLLLALGGQIIGQVNIPSQGRAASGLVGLFCVSLGIGLYLFPVLAPHLLSAAATKTEVPVTQATPSASATAPTATAAPTAVAAATTLLAPTDPPSISISGGPPTISGVWVGIFVSDGGVLYQYRMELVQSGPQVTGTAQATQLSNPQLSVTTSIQGSFSAGMLHFEEYAIIHDSTGVACFITGSLAYNNSLHEETLSGTWQGRPGSNSCPGGGTLDLRRPS